MKRMKPTPNDYSCIFLLDITITHTFVLLTIHDHRRTNISNRTNSGVIYRVNRQKYGFFINFYSESGNYHQPKRPAPVETEHPKSTVNANKFKMNPGILDFGFPV